jgi:hypothetical protein
MSEEGQWIPPPINEEWNLQGGEKCKNVKIKHAAVRIS